MYRILKAPLVIGLILAFTAIAQAEKGYVVDGDRVVHGPIVYQNLALFIITGKESLPDGADYVTLDEAMKNEWVIVHETGNVNTLAIENITNDRIVVILAGAVVKGGKQDRVLSHDLVLKPKSGKIQIGSFCVEQSRWQQRGSEKLSRFNSNSIQVSGKSLRKAVKGGLGQSRVWKEVAEEQKKLSFNIKSNVQENASPSSFQLAVENKDLQKELGSYKAALSKTLKKYPDAIGYAVSINGEFSTADVYANRGLLRKMWGQHLASAITEAISVKDKAKSDQKVDLGWRDEIFKEQTFEERINRTTGGANTYVADQNRNFFRYNCVLPENGKVALRSSYEKRDAGESLAQQPAQQNAIPQLRNSLQRNRQDEQQSEQRGQ